MQQTAVTLNTKVYTPSGVSQGVAAWADRSSGVFTAISNLTATYKDSPKSEVIRVGSDIGIPVVSETDTACTCAGSVLRTSRAKLEMLLPKTGTKAERTDLRLRLIDWLGSADAIAMIDDLDQPYG